VAVGVAVHLGATPAAAELVARAVAAMAVASDGAVPVTTHVFLDHLAPAFARWEAMFADQGFAPIRTAWLSKAARLGETITARLPGEEVTGVFDTIDAEGHLVLRTSGGLRHIAAGEVFFQV